MVVNCIVLAQREQALTKKNKEEVSENSFIKINSPNLYIGILILFSSAPARDKHLAESVRRLKNYRNPDREPIVSSTPYSI